MTTTTQEPNRNRRWLQFSLRLAMIVVLCWIGLRLQRARANRDRMAAVAKTVDAIEDLSDEVEGKYVELRHQTWLEELFDDPGGAADPVGVLKMSPLGPRWSAKEKAHMYNKAVINATIERFYVDTGNWPSNDLNEMVPPTTYEYFPDGLPINPFDGSFYTMDKTTHRVP